MGNQKIIDEIGDELKEISQMGGDVDTLETNNDEEEEVETTETEGDEPEEEEGDTSEVEEEEEEPEEEPEKPQKTQLQPKVPNSNKAKDRFNRSENKRGERLNSLEQKLDKVLEAIASGKIGKAEGDEKVQDAVDSYAAKHKLDPTAIKELVGIIETRLKPTQKVETEPEETEEDPIEEIGDEPEYNAEEQAQIFDEEWTGLEEQIRSIHPNASPKQILAAKRKMEEISHSSEAFANASLASIYKANTQLFGELLFSPKKKGGENGFLGNIDEQAEDKGFKFDEKTMTPKKVADLERMLDDAASEEEDGGGLKIMRDGEEITE